MSAREWKWRSVFLWAGVTVVAAAVLLYVIVPAAFGAFAVVPLKASVGATPAGFTSVTLPTSGGYSLAGWYATSENGAAIILLHGAGGSREAVRVWAVMLARYGYGVLAVDLRGHGQSGGRTNKFGWGGSADVRPAVDFLLAAGVQRIGGLGVSMGGETLLGAAAEFPQLSAIVADGATRRTLAEMLALPAERPLARNFTARVMFAAVGVLSGDSPPPPLLDSMERTRRTSFLLIAAGSNPLETAYNRLFADTVGQRADLWVAPGASHTGAFGLYPAEYERRVISFFDRILLTGPSPTHP